MIIHLQMRFNDIKNSRRKGIITQEAWQLEQNRILDSILSLIHSLDSTQLDAEEIDSIIKRHKNNYNSIENSSYGVFLKKKNPLFITLVLIISSGLIFFVLSLNKSKNKVDLNRESIICYQDAVGYARQQDFHNALEAINKAIRLQSGKYDFFELQSECYLQLGNYSDGLKSVENALALDPHGGPEGCIYATLAQIKSLLGDTEGFYLNIEKSMQFGCDIWNYQFQKGTVDHKEEPRFQELLQKYIRY